MEKHFIMRADVMRYNTHNTGFEQLVSTLVIYRNEKLFSKGTDVTKWINDKQYESLWTFDDVA
jgi:hypothetical protein